MAVRRRRFVMPQRTSSLADGRMRCTEFNVVGRDDAEYRIGFYIYGDAVSAAKAVAEEVVRALGRELYPRSPQSEQALAMYRNIIVKTRRMQTVSIPATAAEIDRLPARDATAVRRHILAIDSMRNAAAEHEKLAVTLWNYVRPVVSFDRGRGYVEISARGYAKSENDRVVSELRGVAEVLRQRYGYPSVQRRQ